MKMTYSEFVERYLGETADDPICENDNLLDWFDGVAALRKILTEVLPLIRDIEASAATVPTVEVDMGEEDDLPIIVEKTDISWVVPDDETIRRLMTQGIGELTGITIHEDASRQPFMGIDAAGDTASLREYIRDGWAKFSAMRAGQGFYDELVAKALTTGSSYYMQKWDTLTGKPRITAVDPYEEEK